jgi:hypothetical protein
MDVTKINGVAGDGNTDCAPALQAALDRGVKLLEFPSGAFRLGRTLELPDCRLRGESRLSTMLFGANEKPLLRSVGRSVRLETMSLVGDLKPGGMAFYGDNLQQSIFDDIRFAGNKGCYLMEPFIVSLRDCHLNGQNGRLTDAGSDVGLTMIRATSCHVDGGDCTGWRTGHRLSGHSVDVSMRFEVCGIGLHLGVDENVHPWGLNGCVIGGFNMEACDTAILAQVVGGCTFQAINGQGSPGAPSGLSKVGIRLETAHNCKFDGVVMNGVFDQATFLMRDSDEVEGNTFNGCRMGNTTDPIRPRWILPATPAQVSRRNQFWGCDNP